MKIRPVFIYILMIIVFLLYITVQTYSYDLLSEKENLKLELKNKKNEYDKLMIKINTKNSREQVLVEFPELEIRDNIFYLEKYE